MGETLSTPSQSNPNSAAIAAASSSTMTSSDSSEKFKANTKSEPAQPPKSAESKSPNHESIENPAEGEALPEKASEDSIGEENDDEEGEEEGECGFCLFMKAGGCKDTFTDWEKCVDEGEKNKEDIVEKCFQATAALKMCMEAHSDYYAPLLQAEKAAEEEAARQLEEEKVRLNNAGDESLGEKEKEPILDGSAEKETS